MAIKLSTSDIVLLLIVGLAAGYYLLADLISKPKIPGGAASSSGSAKAGSAAEADGEDTGRDFFAALQKAKKKIVIFYGSQTGTAEDYALRIAKELKSRYGLSSLVCDPEEYDFDVLDKITKEMVVIFSVATYGEGEPTDNAVGFMEFIQGEDVQFSGGESDLSNLNYVVWSLGNRTYEQFCAVGRNIDKALSGKGATRIGERGEGDDDKSMEEDYLEWKDAMFEALAKQMGWEEGAGADSADFEVSVMDGTTADDSKVFIGELSQRMLSGTRGVYDAKNPFISPLKESRELFQSGDRNCIHGEFDITDSGIRYQAGDHVGIWPVNPDNEVVRWFKLLGLEGKENSVVQITSLDPALAKVPFPTPCTYDAIFRHYIDISAPASRQALGAFIAYAPTPEAGQRLQQIAGDKNIYHSEVAEKCLKLSEVLLAAAGDDIHADPQSMTPKQWHIPFDRIVSGIPRLQPRYYSISSSPKLNPSSIHITAVVLKYQPDASDTSSHNSKHVYGVGTNYLLNLKRAANNEGLDERTEGAPVYRIEGPRGRFKKDGALCAPIHVRRSNFRLPTSPKIPVIMIGPGTGVAPFRGFIQERVALARKAKEKDGPDALKEWGTISLFYGCRRSEWDFLYKKEWEAYQEELGDCFKLFVAFSREPGQPKKYVQQLIKEQEPLVKESMVDKKGYVYICGDAKNMARDVEELLKEILGKAKNGTKEKEGEAEWKTMKDRNRILLDVWS